MKIVCSFCDSVIRPGDTPDDPVSHGVCPACYRTILRDHGFDILRFLNLLGAPVFLVDRDVNVLAANSRAAALTGKPLARIRGEICGTVIDCINACLPEGCGKTPSCPDCTIRNTVNETYATGSPVDRRPAFFVRESETGTTTVRLLVSTRREGEIVLLRLEPAGEAQPA